MLRCLVLATLVACGESRLPDETLWHTPGFGPNPGWHAGLVGATAAGAFVGGYDTARTYAAADGTAAWIVDQPTLYGPLVATTDDAIFISNADAIMHRDPGDGHVVATVPYRCNGVSALAAAGNFVAHSCMDYAANRNAVDVWMRDTEVPLHTVPHASSLVRPRGFALGPHGEVVTIDARGVLRSYDPTGALAGMLAADAAAQFVIAGDGDVFVGDAGTLSRMSPAFEPRWSQPLEGNDPAVPPELHVAGDGLIVIDGTSLTRIERDGTVVTRVSFAATVKTVEVAAGITYAFVSDSPYDNGLGTLVALDLEGP